MLFQIGPTHFNPWLSCFCIHYCTYLIKEHPYWDGSMNILNESNDFGCSQVKTAVNFQWKNGNIKNSINCKYCILSSVALAHLYPRRNNPSLASGSRKPELLAVQHGWDGCWTWVSSLPYWRLSHMYLTLVNSAFWNIVHPLMFTPFLLQYASEVVFSFQRWPWLFLMQPPIKTQKSRNKSGSLFWLWENSSQTECWPCVRTTSWNTLR